MAYTGFYQEARGLAVAQRADGAFFMRENSGFGPYGHNPGKWFLVKSIERDSVGDIFVNGINFGDRFHKFDDLAYRMDKNVKGVVFSIPDFETIDGSPKIIRVEDRYEENNGAFQVVYWRDMAGKIQSRGNMYDQNSDLRNITIEELIA